MNALIIASRESRLALWQAEFVQQQLTALHPEMDISIFGMTTRGDQILDLHRRHLLEQAEMAARSIQDRTVDHAACAGEIDQLDAPFGVVKVEHRVERMVIQRGAGGPGQFCRCQNAVTPC